MKRFLFGLLSGLFICCGAYFIMLPGISERSYTRGYGKGVEEGYVHGAEQGHTDQKRYDDSVHSIVKRSESLPVKRPREPKQQWLNPNDKNYTVVGNQVVEERK